MDLELANSVDETTTNNNPANIQREQKKQNKLYKYVVMYVKKIFIS